MKKIMSLIALAVCPMFSQAGISQVHGAKIQNIEFYGDQFTVLLDKQHSSKGCGHPGNVVSLDSSKEPGKTHYSALMTVWVAGKSINMRITDAICNGDRPTLLNWSAY
ncbi:exported hypothetical protein [Vibrio nigripulchritudo MADA3029]|uniref:hypothetical protein n=1 Tax=Vibrio nigripulchritudo TaxID=28173 RepID=UPI0003B17DD4|nr:hypothetical protein [Vibrio nigripulchritudo]CCN46704.1 exported hypothetical protein [Vibrio nigripulchritudo MADA3020]CCN54519.1 exported hypothetical protein [Vibrio nigripulchritudo MADA3021]CCN59562.1 exported hypothetical protein [Vibrio nigripulchritudo MADA3029]